MPDDVQHRIALRRAQRKVRAAQRESRGERAGEPDERMITTRDDLPGFVILETVGVVGAESVRTMNLLQDFGVDLRDEVGGRSGVLEKQIRDARSECLQTLWEQAYAREANAVVGLRLDISAADRRVLIITATGTAVRVVADALPEGSSETATNGVAPTPQDGGG